MQLDYCGIERAVALGGVQLKIKRPVKAVGRKTHRKIIFPDGVGTGIIETNTLLSPIGFAL